MICWSFQAWGWWRHDAGVLKIKGLEPQLPVLKIRSNCTQISGFSEVQKSMNLCTWNQNYAFELLDFQSILMCYHQMVYDISAGTGDIQSRHPWTASDVSQFDPFISPHWHLVCSDATKVFLVSEAQRWSSNTDSGVCPLLIMFWYLPLSTFPTGQWTTKSTQSDSVPDMWRLMAGAPWSQSSRRKTQEEPCLQRYKPVCHSGQISQPYHSEGEGLCPLVWTTEEGNELSNDLSHPLASSGWLAEKGN